MPAKTRSKRTPSHLDSDGRARMVDVGAKPVTTREAFARGRVFMHAETLALVQEHDTKKGDVLTVAKLAGIQAAKRTGETIPLAHTLPLDGVDVRFSFDEVGPSLGIEARVASTGKTGVEMEALCAVAVAALTVYDMMKAVDRGMVIGEIALWEKRGGKSGDWRRKP
jgi:cyclic pyranopterin phosphate synthase